MKKYNFNTINNLSTPEGWIEKALEIPQIEEKRRSEVRRRGVRYVSLAASIVLVGALAVVLFMNKVGQPPVVTAPLASETVPYEFESTTQAPTQAPTAAATVAVTAAQPTDAPARAASSAQPGTQGAVSQPEPSDIYDEPASPPASPAAPTEAPAQPPAPTQAPTQPPEVAPTEAPEDKRPDLAPVGYDGIIIETVPKEDLSEDSVIYCRLCAEDGTPLDDGDPYSDQHLAQMFADGGEIMMYYIPCDCTTLPYEGLYRYEFYDDTGKILCGGNEYLKP